LIRKVFGKFITGIITEACDEIGLHTVSGAAILTVRYGSVAQLAEQVTFNHLVTGSNPVGVMISPYSNSCEGFFVS
jgi:hypothetical protein